MELYLFYIALSANIIAFSLCFIDKRRSERGRGLQRISERTLMFSALLFGGPGFFLSMLLFHHKTRHLKFLIGVPVISAAEYSLILYFLLTRN